MAATMAQLIINVMDTKVDSLSEVPRLIPRNMRQRARVPVNIPNPSVCANAIEIVPAARA
jgi:hypothetical protein